MFPKYSCNLYFLNIILSHIKLNTTYYIYVVFINKTYKRNKLHNILRNLAFSTNGAILSPNHTTSEKGDYEGLQNLHCVHPNTNGHDDLWHIQGKNVTWGSIQIGRLNVKPTASLLYKNHDATRPV